VFIRYTEAYHLAARTVYPRRLLAPKPAEFNNFSTVAFNDGPLDSFRIEDMYR
jgi:hypothetical protein